MKPGRNSPCPCGSGRKYKKCCLPRDEAATRESQQLGLAEWDTGEPVEWLADDPDADDEYGETEPRALDPAAIRSIRYARGFVERLADAWDDRKLEVTVWTAPEIPQVIVDAVAREAIWELEGRWGDPRAGTPIQVDALDIELDDDLISIEVFNRAINLLHADSEELRRLHRVLEILRQTAGRGEAQPISTAQDVRPAPAFGLEDALKQHRNQGGSCELCDQSLKRTTASRHYASCSPRHDVQKGPIQELIQLRITAPGLAGYWLDAEARADATLETLDSFLRRTWLECCGHLSKFTAGAVEYFSRGYELNAFSASGPMFGSPRVGRRMSARLGVALPPVGGTVGYEYDFGSTTGLVIRVTGTREGRIGRTAVRALGRNTPLFWPCAHCGETASLMCALCRYEDTNPFVCDAHAGPAHHCGEDAYLPVVNSPRLGVCGYTGEM